MKALDEIQLNTLPVELPTNVVSGPMGTVVDKGDFTIHGRLIIGQGNAQHLIIDGAGGALQFFNSSNEPIGSVFATTTTSDFIVFTDSDGVLVASLSLTEGDFILSGNNANAAFAVPMDGAFLWTGSPNYGFISGIQDVVGLRGSLVPVTDNAYDLGVNGNRWRLVRGVTITPGDLKFENDWVVTEHDKVGIKKPGLAFTTPEGKLVMFLAEDGLYMDTPVKSLSELK